MSEFFSRNPEKQIREIASSLLDRIDTLESSDPQDWDSGGFERDDEIRFIRSLVDKIERS
jgi:uncharacterized Fe-S radical SAM superfamily protein PflX